MSGPIDQARATTQTPPAIKISVLIDFLLLCSTLWRRNFDARRLEAHAVARTPTGHDVLNDECYAIRDVRNSQVKREMWFLAFTRSAGVGALVG
jgi:hypothetical protein